MKLCDINPFLRYAKLQPSVITGTVLSCAYDYRIFYILEGTATLMLSNQAVPLCPGMLICFRPATPYCFEGKAKVIVLNFDLTRTHASKKTPRAPSKMPEDFDEAEVFENDPPVELSQVLILEKAFEIEGRLRDCLLHYSYPSSVSDALTSAILKEILCYAANRAARLASILPEAVQRAILYIQQNYDKDIGNEQISAELGYHSFYLNRIFKKSMGITIHRAVIRERMRIARHLLTETALSVSKIASEVGFADHARFCTAFKKYVGYTPLEYRRNNCPK